MQPGSVLLRRLPALQPGKQPRRAPGGHNGNTQALLDKLHGRLDVTHLEHRIPLQAMLREYREG